MLILPACSGDGDGLDNNGNPMNPTQPNTVTVSASKDNTLYDDGSGSVSNGSGEYFMVGRVGTNPGGNMSARRAVVAFDLSGASIPQGATVTKATLTLSLSRRPGTGAGPTDIALHRLTADWGEGASNAGFQAGQGATAETGDATWIHTFYNTSTWATPGGDFVATASATITVDFPAAYSWSDAGMVADVQEWLDTPANNFGWILIGDETTLHTARGFDSRETAVAALRPRLVIEYTP